MFGFLAIGGEGAEVLHKKCQEEEQVSGSYQRSIHERRFFMSLEKLFHLKENHTDVKTEVLAGITTFMTMAYILAVNPGILGATGMDSGAVFTATAVSALFATLCMAFMANYPFVLAPGMGLKRLLCLYRSFTDGILMGNGFNSRICRRYHFHPSVTDQCT